MIGNEVAFVLESRSAVESVLRALSRFSCREGAGGTQRVVYYDTFDGRLHRAGSSLSAAEEEDGWRLAWRNGSGSDRIVRAPEPIAFATELPEGHLREALLPLVEMRRLLPLVEVESKGPELDVVDDEEKTVVRLHLEEGRARAPRERSTWHELPLVLRVSPVRGYEREWKAVLEELSGLSELASTSSGPLEVALQAIGKRANDRRTAAPVLEPDVRADVGLKHVCAALLETMLTNEGGVRASLDTEFLHDFRVAVRKTRALLGQLRGVFAEPVVEHFRGELKWLGGATGPTRDLDVFLLELDDLAHGQADADIAPLREFLRLRQERAHAELVLALDSPRFLELVEGWERFLAEPVLPEPPQENAARPLRGVAAERIRKLHRRVLRDGRDIDADSPPPALHRLRLDCKKLRYVLDAAKSLYDEGEVRVVIGALKRLQDVLGDFNDACVQTEKLREFGFAMAEEGRAPVGTLLAMGRIAGRTAARAEHLREKFAKRFAAFATKEEKRRVRALSAPGDGA